MYIGCKVLHMYAHIFAHYSWQNRQVYSPVLKPITRRREGSKLAFFKRFLHFSLLYFARSHSLYALLLHIFPSLGNFLQQLKRSRRCLGFLRKLILAFLFYLPWCSSSCHGFPCQTIFFLYDLHVHKPRQWERERERDECPFFLDKRTFM